MATETAIITREAKQARAWAYYSAGWPLDAIATEMRCSVQTVKGWLSTKAAQAKALREHLAGGYVERELSGLDALERLLVQDVAAAADPAERALLTKVILDVKARRAKYLGLDKPAEIKVGLSLEDLVSRATAPPPPGAE